MARTLQQLAQEAIDIQDGCNPLGLSKGYARALQELREALTALQQPDDTDAIKRHPINHLWVSKLADLMRVGDFSAFSNAYDACKRQAASTPVPECNDPRAESGEIYTCARNDCPVHGERNRSFIA